MTRRPALLAALAAALLACGVRAPPRPPEPSSTSRRAVVEPAPVATTSTPGAAPAPSPSAATTTTPAAPTP